MPCQRPSYAQFPAIVAGIRGQAMRSSAAVRFGRAGNPIGDRVLKQRVPLCASIVAFSLAALSAGLAQPGPPPYPGTVYPGEGMILPPYEVAAIVRSTGLEPLGRPVRQGQAYAVRAIDEAGEEVRVIVDARIGRIVKVIPLMEPRYARARRAGRTAAAAAAAEA